MEWKLIEHEQPTENDRKVGIIMMDDLGWVDVAYWVAEKKQWLNHLATGLNTTTLVPKFWMPIPDAKIYQRYREAVAV